MEPSLPLATHTLKSSKLKNKVFIIFISMVLCTALLGLLQLKFLKPRYKDFYSFEVKDWKGRTMSLERYRGKATLVVNVASYCQHTEKNYIMLQELQREFGSSHFTVLAFPCNQFGEMEPGLNDEIIYFAKSNYGVTFPIFSKIKILGTEASPAFKFLIGSYADFAGQTVTKEDHMTLGDCNSHKYMPVTKYLHFDHMTMRMLQRSWKLTDATKKEPKWNFWKYLISPEGKVVKYLKPEEPIENIKQDIAALIREIIIKKREEL